jgi:hypothetical protein
MRGGSNESMRIDSDGRLLVGTGTALETFGGTLLQVAHAAGATAVLGRNDSTVAENDPLGSIYFDTFAGESWQESAHIRCFADAAQGSGDVPSRLVFSTTADGAASPTERMRISSNGNIGVGTVSPQTELHLQTSGATGPTIRLNGTAPLAADSLLGGIDFFNNDGSGFGPQVGAFVRANAVGSGGDGGYLTFGTNDAATGSEGADATEKMRID